MNLWTRRPEDLWTEDIHLYKVVWTYGPVDLWTCGPVDLWTCGHEDLGDLWTEDIHLYEAAWTCGYEDLRICELKTFIYMKQCKLVDL